VKHDDTHQPPGITTIAELSAVTAHPGEQAHTVGRLLFLPCRRRQGEYSGSSDQVRPGLVRARKTKSAIFVFHSPRPCSSPQSGNSKLLCKSAFLPICLPKSMTHVIHWFWRHFPVP